MDNEITQCLYKKYSWMLNITRLAPFLGLEANVAVSSQAVMEPSMNATRQSNDATEIFFRSKNIRKRKKFFWMSSEVAAVLLPPPTTTGCCCCCCCCWRRRMSMPAIQTFWRPFINLKWQSLFPDSDEMDSLWQIQEQACKKGSSKASRAQKFNCSHIHKWNYCHTRGNSHLQSTLVILQSFLVSYHSGI